MGFEDMDFSDYDVVISSTYAGYSKGLITGPDTLHISYVHNVPRYLWHLPTALHGTLNPIWENLILPPLEHYWRMWDRMSAQRPDHLICNSKVVAERVRRYYQRDSEVVYPPVEIERFLDKPVKSGNYWIHFGRVEQYKNIDIAIKSCIKNKQRLVIAGTGDYEKELKKLTKELKGEKYIEFTGWVEDDELEYLISGSKGFVFPGVSEDFGIVLVEAMAAGKPVIAFETIGSKDIVVDGKTGVLVKDFSNDSFSEALKQGWKMKFDPDICRERSKKFSQEKFEEGINSHVEKWIKE
jgi:glycosyltransferase involved in cell wall biosynthesis